MQYLLALLEPGDRWLLCRSSSANEYCVLVGLWHARVVILLALYLVVRTPTLSSPSEVIADATFVFGRRHFSPLASSKGLLHLCKVHRLYHPALNSLRPALIQFIVQISCAYLLCRYLVRARRSGCPTLPCLPYPALLACPTLALPSLGLAWLGLACLTLPYLALPCLVLPCLALPCRTSDLAPALPFRVLPFPTLLNPTLPYPRACPAVPCSTLPHSALPCPALPYPTLPYPTLH